MAAVIRIVRGKNVIDDIRRISFKFPEAIGAASEEFGKSLQKSLKGGLTSKGLRWTGKLHDSIKWVQTSKTSGELRMLRYGVAQDIMKPHSTWARKGRKMHRWALAKGNLGVRVLALSERHIFVKPTPWIEAPLQRTIKRLPKILDRHANNLIKSKGRRK